MTKHSGLRFIHKAHKPFLYISPALLTLTLATCLTVGTAHSQPQNQSPSQASPHPDACDAWLVSPPAPGQNLQTLITQALALELHCPRHAAFLYQLGSLLNQAGRYEEALDRLEAALMRQPDHWPTQFEYAVALAGVGDTASATGLLHNLAQHPGLDDASRAQVLALQRQTASQQPAAPRVPWLTLGLAAGYDDNLLGNSHLTQFELTLVDGRLPVETDPSQRPKAGGFARADLRYNATLAATPSALWRTSLLASQRHSPPTPQARLDHAGALLERLPLAPTGLYLLGLYQTLARANRTELRQTQLAVGLEHTLALAGRTCRQRLLLHWQHTRYPTSTLLDGRAAGVGGQADCPALGLQLQWRLGRDAPFDAERPGGAQNQLNLRLGYTRPFGASSISIETDFSAQQDRTGYSPLLENNARRRTQRTNWHLEYRWPAQSVQPYVSLDWLDGRANLPLFEVRNRVLSLGLRAQW